MRQKLDLEDSQQVGALLHPCALHAVASYQHTVSNQHTVLHTAFWQCESRQQITSLHLCVLLASMHVLLGPTPQHIAVLCRSLPKSVAWLPGPHVPERTSFALFCTHISVLVSRLCISCPARCCPHHPLSSCAGISARLQQYMMPASLLFGSSEGAGWGFASSP